MYISQTYFGFTNLGSQVHSFWVIAVWIRKFWSWTPCTIVWIWLNHVICPKQNLVPVNFFMNLNSLTLRYSGMCFLNNKKIVMVFLCEFLLLLLLCAITKFRSAKNSLRSSWSPFQQKEKRNLRKMTIVSLSTKRGRNFSQMMQVWGTFWGY